MRRLERYGMSARGFTEIVNGDLDNIISEVLTTHPTCGEVMLKGFLRQRSVHVPRQALRDAMHRVDGEGAFSRRRRRLQRIIYHVEGPNHLWHIDGNHKLIRWGFVIQGDVDGFSRLPVFLKCATNNKASTVLEAFYGAVERYGLPLRLRSDAGGENVKVWQYMNEHRGERSAIIGKEHSQSKDRKALARRF
ncbi:uncharacterized protein LOC117118640 [Anneissia japonica]|uniref:uncharacterized protein LOC117118640 n=1 Tax=Anneissia japonica TaxID=1529436 RepID=UPI00142594B2|nr:uncharacterized protein LOC117118640 [Anneissia japonica]